jgi:Flp pilus assembly protein TadB
MSPLLLIWQRRQARLIKLEEQLPEAADFFAAPCVPAIRLPM